MQCDLHPRWRLDFCSQGRRARFFYFLKVLPVTQCNNSISVLAVVFICIWIPVATPHSFNQLDADAVTLDRQ